MTDRLRQIEERVNGATEGPWRVVGRHGGHRTNWIMVTSGTLAMAAADYEADAAFIAHARSDIPWLLAALAEMEADRDQHVDRADQAERRAASLEAALREARKDIIAAHYAGWDSERKALAEAAVDRIDAALSSPPEGSET